MSDVTCSDCKLVMDQSDMCKHAASCPGSQLATAAAFRAGWTAAFNADAAAKFGGEDSDTPRTCDEALLEWLTDPCSTRLEGGE